MSRKLYTRTCADCGKVVHNAGPNMQRCPECARRHDLALRREQGEHERELKNRRKMEELAEERSRALHADALAAKQAGVSYGKYMLTKNKKPSGVTSTGEPAKG